MEIIKRAHFTDFTGAEHCSWVVRSGMFKYYYIDFNTCPLDTNEPEAMAFKCDKDGHVLNWSELAVSYDTNPTKAIHKCIAQLRKQGLIND